MISKDIFSYIKEEETAYHIPIEVISGMEWNMPEHIRISTLYKNSRYLKGNQENKPFKNIIRPILNLQNRAVGFDVKDIDLYVNDSSLFYKSFLIKKYHEKWARENNLDTFIDEIVENYNTFGGALVKNINSPVPEVVEMQSIAFCDQTDMMSGPIGIRHQYSPDQLKEMEKYGWGGATADCTIDDLITLAETSKVSDDQSGKENDTPGKYIEIYEVHGTFPLYFLGEKSEDYVSQIHIVGFYNNKDGDRVGLTLYKAEEKEFPFKLIKRDKIFGRALGIGGAEELFEPQVWVNYNLIRMKEMLDAASKTIFKTTDAAFANRNKIFDMDNLEIAVLAENKDIAQIDTFPRNMSIFDRATQEWELHAQQTSAATEPIMGQTPKSGTPFASQELAAAEAHSLHEYRKGQIASFLDEIYRDWIISHIVKEIIKGQEFLAELDLDEAQTIAENITIHESNKMIIKRILDGQIISRDEVEAFKQGVLNDFMKQGTKKFLKIIKNEMKKAPIDIKVNIVGKQKYMAAQISKLTNIFGQVLANPSVLDNPKTVKLFNIILESSGISPISFGSIGATSQIPQIQTGKVTLEVPKEEKKLLPV